MKQSGWGDDLVASMIDDKAAASPAPKKGKPQRAAPSMERNPSFHYTMDAVLAGGVLVLTLLLAFPLGTIIVRALRTEESLTPAYAVMFGLPLAIACFYYSRPPGLGWSGAAVSHL